MALFMLNMMRSCAVACFLSATLAAAALMAALGSSTRDNPSKRWCSVTSWYEMFKPSLGPKQLELINRVTLQIGVMDDRTSSSDYDSDMQQAKAAGIDAFALNIGIDAYTDTQLTSAYESAA